MSTKKPAGKLFFIFLMTIFCVAALCAQNDGMKKNQSEMDKSPTVEFCDLIKMPKLYFNKTLRLTATYESAENFDYLSDVRCVTSEDKQISARWNQSAINPPPEVRLEEDDATRVTVVGVLHDGSQRGSACYHRYCFDIVRLEKAEREDESRLINNYNGTLKEGWTYRATVRSDRDSGLMPAFFPLRSAQHQAARIEWTNLKHYPSLRKPRVVRQIVFKVTADEIAPLGEGRWSRTVKCRIIIVE
jgi:hypothetical protein